MAAEKLLVQSSLLDADTEKNWRQLAGYNLCHWKHHGKYGVAQAAGVRLHQKLVADEEQHFPSESEPVRQDAAALGYTEWLQVRL